MIGLNQKLNVSSASDPDNGEYLLTVARIGPVPKDNPLA
jgi:hypothetical protein